MKRLTQMKAGIEIMNGVKERKKERKVTHLKLIMKMELI